MPTFGDPEHTAARKRHIKKNTSWFTRRFRKNKAEAVGRKYDEEEDRRHAKADKELDEKYPEVKNSWKKDAPADYPESWKTAGKRKRRRSGTKKTRRRR